MAIAAVLAPIEDEEIESKVAEGFPEDARVDEFPEDALFQSAWARLRTLRPEHRLESPAAPVVVPVATSVSSDRLAEAQVNPTLFAGATSSLVTTAPALTATEGPSVNEIELPWPIPAVRVDLGIGECASTRVAPRRVRPATAPSLALRRVALHRQRRAATLARRRRTLLFAGVVAAMVLLALPLSSFGGHRLSGGSSASGSQGTSYVVQPGDTLWSIASHVTSGTRVRSVVRELAHQIGSTSVTPGERIVLP